MYVNPFIRDLHRVKFHGERGGVLRLDMNESPEGLPTDFVEGVKEKITPGFLATYPEKDRIVAMLAEANGIGTENITVTSGSDEAQRLAIQCFGETGKKLVSVIPTFEMYGVYAKMYGMEHVTVPYRDDFTVSGADVCAAIDGDTGIVVILNPNSPVGSVYSEKETREIVRKAGEVGALVLVDEAYHHFYPGTFITFVREFGNVLLLRTFSKAYSIAGLRIGFAAGAEGLIDALERAEATFNVNNVALLFAEELLKRPDILERQRVSEAEGRRWLTEKLTEAGYQTLSLEGSFVLFKPRRSSGEIVNELKERDIWVRDYRSGLLAGYVRVSTGGVRSMRVFWDAFLEVDG